MATVLITGGSGLIGNRLSRMLIDRGYTVTHLTQTSSNLEGVRSYSWNVDAGSIDEQATSSADYIINLAGAGIADKRWTKARKKQIADSRINGTKLLYTTLKEQPTNNTKAIISASAIGYYGAITSDKIFHEKDPPAGDFLGTTCQLWECQADRFTELGIRVVKIRTGIVLSDKGGALPKMGLPIRLYVGAPLGLGNQFVPCIHIDDLCNIFIKAIEDKNLSGAYNAVCPDHTSNTELTNTITNVLKRPLFLPNIPGWLLKLALGEMADTVLEGSKVSCNKITAAGFKFEYENVENALKAIYT